VPKAGPILLTADKTNATESDVSIKIFHPLNKFHKIWYIIVLR
jgi:hypothetical protein